MRDKPSIPETRGSGAQSRSDTASTRLLARFMAPLRSVAGKIRRFVQSKDRSTYVDKFIRRRMRSLGGGHPLRYDERFKRERARFDDVLEVNDLPPIFHYWSNTHLAPLLSEFDVANPYDWFARRLRDSVAGDRSDIAVFASIGAGNCDTEVAIAQRLRELGVSGFVIECLDMNDSMLARGRGLARSLGLDEHFQFTSADLNHWRPERRYDAFMANQSLHHIVGLEHVFDEVRRALVDGGRFVIGDTIGRNGHMRWPEALAEVRSFWSELPDSYRFNRLLQRHESRFQDWDCSSEGFEGIRAQDIVPELARRFHFHEFIGFGNVIDPFVDRAFGHHFDVAAAWDRDFIDRIHACDEQGLKAGTLTPTHMFAVLAAQPPADGPRFARGVSPQSCIDRVTRPARHPATAA